MCFPSTLRVRWSGSDKDTHARICANEPRLNRLTRRIRCLRVHVCKDISEALEYRWVVKHYSRLSESSISCYNTFERDA